MNQKNLEFLANQLKYTGFPEAVMEKVRENIDNGLKEFAIPHSQDYGRDQTAATLHFRKSDTTDNYFFNKYNVVLKTPIIEEPIKHGFYINADQKNITYKEAYNLLSGRAVHKEITPKEGEKFKAWLQLDLKNPDAEGNFKMRQFHPGYGYDLANVLGNRPIKEMNNEETRKELMQSLERGNRQQVTFLQGDKEVKAFIEAAPQFKSLNYYAENHKRIDFQQIKNALEPGHEKSLQKDHAQKQEVKADDEEARANKKGKQRKQAI